MLTTRKRVLRYSARLVFFASVIAFDAHSNDTDIKIDISDYGISVAAENKKLSDVLVKLGDQTNIAVTGADTIDLMFDGQVTGNDVEEVLTLLGVSSMLVWDDSSEGQIIREMILLSASDEGSDFLPSGDTVELPTATNEVASQQLNSESSPIANIGVSSTISDSATSSALGMTDPEDAADSSNASTSPGIGFSVDLNSATDNPQQ